MPGRVRSGTTASLSATVGPKTPTPVGTKTLGGKPAAPQKPPTSSRRRRQFEFVSGTVSIDAVQAEFGFTGPINRQPAPPLEVPLFGISARPDIPPNPPRAAFRNTLQATIDAASEGSLIEVPAGVYDESLTIKKTLFLTALGDVTIASDTRNDSVNVSAPLVSFTGFKISMTQSQAANAVKVVSGQAIFRNCTISSVETTTVSVQKAKGFFIGCNITCENKIAVTIGKVATLDCESSQFFSKVDTAVRAGGESTTKFTKCVGKSGDPTKPSFLFGDKARFLFEEATVDHPLEVYAQSDHAVIKKCVFEKVNLDITKSGTPYVIDCTFKGTTLVAREKCGVRLIKDRFLDTAEQPGLLVHDEAQVEANECEFRTVSAPAAAVAYQQSSLKLFDGRFIDLSGVGVLAFGQVEVLLERCGFGNIANTALVAHGGAQVDITESLFDHVNSVGVLLKDVLRVSVTKSKFVNSTLSGMELNAAREAVIDHCIFEQNGQCGLLAIGSKVNVRESDFVKNRMTGLDCRTSEFDVARCVALDNVAGGFSFRERSTGQIAGGGAGTNEQFGLAAVGGSTVNIPFLPEADGEWGRFQWLENEHLALFVSGGAEVNIERGKLCGNQNIAIMAEGEATKLTLHECDFEENGVAIQACDRITIGVDKGTFTGNGLHVEVRENAKVDAKGATFSQSKDGIGAYITDGGKGTFLECEFTEEARTAIATDATLIIAKSAVRTCGICGVFAFGGASLELKANQIENNGPCGVQLMGGVATLEGNTISEHTTFGVHVDPKARVDESGNTYSHNAMSDVNVEEEGPPE